MRTLRNFDLAIEAQGDGYLARVVASPAGETEGSFVLPFSEQDLEILILKITGSVSSTRRRVRRLESVEQRLLEDFGGRLFQAVFTGSIRSCLERSLTAAEDEDSGLRLRLRLAAPLENIPWEFLYDRDYGFLCLSPDTPLVRYVAMPKPVQPFPVRPPLRILAMISAPSDVPGLQNEEEWDKLQTSLSHLIARGMVQLDRLPVGSLSALQRPLRQQDYHVLHFVGHGLYDEDADDGALVLEDESGRARIVTGRALGTMLRGQRSLRLVVLNACEGARSSVDDPFGGVAQALVRQGVPAVIAMQFEISDPAAVVFSQSFYEAVADLLPADVAVVEARKAIFAADNDVEWATPVIYLRAPDGQIFAEPPPPDPDEQRQRQFAEWHNAVAAAMGESRWDDAIAVLDRLIAAGENSPTTVERLQFAHSRQHQAVLIAELRRLHAAGEWAAVLSVAAQLDELVPRDRETDSLIASAKAELEAAARERDRAARQPVIAGMGDRLLARFVDLSLYLIPFVLLTPSSTTETSSAEPDVAYVLWLGGDYLAAAICEVVLTAIWGCTLGKRLVRLRVVRDDDGRPIGWREALLRWLIQFLGWGPCLFIGAAVIYATPFWDKTGRNRGWHDRVAGTVVVKLPPR
ncbi:CHAT domain-containing protein [Kribbella speibonae]|uniref:CHAT domain-containing protein n=1 Tax=Kribbella speibonae TaxID=1572660 RepID=A0A4V2M5W8_9ACTN|nr:CHAT domain-containing protein [Kribbella speibonae]TCC41212.1 CHAT domain-containing protein [Kribbella speibonae]